jgi:molybdenum cofactor cytidylyltransferase
LIPRFPIANFQFPIANFRLQDGAVCDSERPLFGESLKNENQQRTQRFIENWQSPGACPGLGRKASAWSNLPLLLLNNQQSKFINFCYLPPMSRAPSFCGVVLAAGESSRMGRDKALLQWPPASAAQPSPGGTFLSAAINSLSPYADMVLVVAGDNEANLAPVVYANGASLVRNPDPSRGQFSSLQTGLQEVLNHGRDAAMVTLVDRPPVKPATLEKLRDAFASAYAEGKWAIIPEYAGKHGHPILIGREMMTVFLRAPATSSAREIEHQHQSHIEYVRVDDPFTTLNVDTPEDYAALEQFVAR